MMRREHVGASIIGTILVSVFSKRNAGLSGTDRALGRVASPLWPARARSSGAEWRETGRNRVRIRKFVPRDTLEKRFRENNLTLEPH
jgi:hypothetical protein